MARSRMEHAALRRAAAWTLVWTPLLLGACGGADAEPAEDHAADAASAPAAAAPAATEAAPMGSADAEDRALAAHELTMAGLGSWRDATANLAALARRDPSVEEHVSAEGDATVAEMEASLNRDPRVRAAIEEAGLSVREYALTTAALYGALSLYQVDVAEGDLPPGASERNLRFVRENEAAIMALLEGIEG